MPLPSSYNCDIAQVDTSWSGVLTVLAERINFKINFVIIYEFRFSLALPVSFTCIEFLPASSAVRLISKDLWRDTSELAEDFFANFFFAFE